MSGKHSKFLTVDNEHWYHDCLVRDADEDRVTIEIDALNVASLSFDWGECVSIEIRGDCELARLIRGAKFHHEPSVQTFAIDATLIKNAVDKLVERHD